MKDDPGPQTGPPITKPLDLFYEYARLDAQVDSRLQRIKELEKANRGDEVQLARLERWLKAVFDANPETTSVSVSVNGVVQVVDNHGYHLSRTAPVSSLCLTMVPEPPPEPDDEAEEKPDPMAGLEIAARF